MKKLLLIGLTAAMTVSFTSCKEKKAEVADDTTVSWHMMFQEQDDLQAVENEINKRISGKLGAKVDIIRQDPSTYNQKIQVMFASGESFDLCWMSPGAGYHNYAAKGALMPLNDLIDKYARKSYEQIPEKFWDAAKIDGEIYGFLNYQIVGRQFGYVMQKDMVDESGFDYQNMKEYKDIEPLLKYINENSPTDITLGLFGGSNYENCLTSYGIEQIAKIGGIRVGDESFKVFNIYEQPEYPELCKLMRDWYNKGYIEKDAATITNGLEMRKKGIVKVWWDMTGPGFEPTFEAGCGGKPVYTKVIVPPIVTSDNIIATMNSISKTSKHPEKAMQLLEMVNTNENDVYNLLCFGIEGMHYKKTGENRIELTENSKYYPNIAWAWGNQFNAYLMPGQDDDLWEKTKELNNTAQTSELLGFCFNTDKVKSQISQVTSVINEYDSLLGTGMVDPEEKYDEFVKKMKTAGSDEIIAELQAQINEWKGLN